MCFIMKSRQSMYAMQVAAYATTVLYWWPHCCIEVVIVGKIDWYPTLQCIQNSWLLKIIVWNAARSQDPHHPIIRVKSIGTRLAIACRFCKNMFPVKMHWNVMVNYMVNYTRTSKRFTHVLYRTKTRHHWTPQLIRSRKIVVWCP